MKSAIAILAVVSATAFGQGMATRISGGGGTASGDRTHWSATANIAAAPDFVRAVTGRPYSGDEVRETVQMRADGSRVTNKTTVQRVFRDSQGRTRVERPIMMPPSVGSGMSRVPTIIEIADPVARRICDLDTQNYVAHCSEAQPLPQSPEPSVLGSVSAQIGGARSVGIGSGPVRSQKREAVYGVETVVTSSERVVLGRAQSYDRNITEVTQTWFSPELGIVMMEKASDLLRGERTFRIENFSRVEPPFDLFQLPANYDVRFESGPFTISYSSP